MEPIGHHVTIRLKADRPLLLDVAERRLAARHTLRLGKPFDLLFFMFADTHAHLIVMQPEQRAAMELARLVELSLHNRLHLGPFEEARPRAVEGTRHLDHAVRYCLRQREHHNIATDPFLEGSSAPDLLGLRDLGAYTRDTLRTWLPRLSLVTVAEHLPAGLGRSETRSYDLLHDAAAAAVALPSLRSKRPDAMRARRAAVQVGQDLPTATLSRLLDVHPSTVRRLRLGTCSPALVQAVRLQLSLRQPALVERVASEAA